MFTIRHFIKDQVCLIDERIQRYFDLILNFGLIYFASFVIIVFFYPLIRQCFPIN